jgi:hypothetical protein
MRCSRSALAAVLFLGALATDANAANLIQNPDFEAAPPANLGNNIGHSIAPWIVGTGNSPNVVKVDGPGGYDYTNLGPESDASAPGAGVKQHYLDIANGANDFYQSFTVPSCPAAPPGTQAKVTFGGYFSGRGNAGGAATITLRQGTGLTGAIIQQVTGTVAAGTSKTDPWVHVQGTATLAYGQTFSYVVAMPNEINFDNAHLSIDTDLCNPPPPPAAENCLSLTPDIKCGPNGTFTVTLNGSNYSGDDITLAAQTAGVMVSPAQQPWAASTTWTISGTTPGQALTLIANATRKGGGAEAGTDQCCSAEIRVTAPECPPPPTGELIVEKKVVYTGPLVMPSGLTYPTTVTCGTWSRSFNLVANIPQSAGGVPLSTACSVAETLPPAPASACPEPKVATWQTPIIVPATPFQLSGVSTKVTVTNTLDCRDGGSEGGSLVVTKQVINNTTVPVPASSVYAVSTSCVSGMSPATVTAMPLVDGGSQTVSGLSLGTVCTIAETPPAPPSLGPVSCGAPGSTLAWTTVLPAPVSITGPGSPALVQNILNCIPPGGGLGTLVVTKKVVNKTQGQVSTAGLVYPFSVSCASGGSPAAVTTFNITENSSYTVSNIALNSSCIVTEPTMPTPSGVCATVGAVPTWQSPPTMTPASPVPVNGTSVPLTVQNTLECRPAGNGLNQGPPPVACGLPLVQTAVPGVCACPAGTLQNGRDCVKQTACKAPLVAGPVPGQCVCPAGTTKRGERCITTLVCRYPARLNASRTACTCPQGMTLKGNTCVQEERRRPAVTPNDVIRVVPGLIGPGGFGGGGRSGGDRGGDKGGGSSPGVR